MEAQGELDLADVESRSVDAGTAPADAGATVVAVVVTRNPEAALNDTLASLATQDHPALSILVIDDGSTEPVLDRVAGVAPGAYVRRFDEPVGYGAAANVVTEMVQGAAYYLFCHDDVALAPDAVRLLVAAAVQQQATIAGPKLVAWEDHERFWSLGYAVDRSGQIVSPIELDELDQGQHDQVRDVTAVHGATILVASETFTAIGGFLASLTDPASSVVAGSEVAGGPDLGEDTDLCLRARRHGDRIVVVPSARVAHQGAVHGLRGPVVGGQPGRRSAEVADTAPVAEQRLLRERNRIRSIISGAGPTRLVVLVPILLAQAIRHGRQTSPVTGRRQGRFTALRLAFGSRAERKSARVLANRAGTDELGHELVAVSSRLRADIRSDVTADSARFWRAAERALGSRRGGRLAFGSFAFVAAVVVFGSRGLLGSGVGRGGRLVELPPLGDLWTQVMAGWHEAGLGQFGAAAPGLILTTLFGTVLFGFTGLAGTLLGVGPLAIGALGMFRAANVTSDVEGRTEHRSGVALAAVVTYLLVPIPFDALTNGDRGALWGYALLPWLMSGIERRSQSSIDAPTRPKRLRLSGLVDVAGPAIVLAVLVAMDPTATIVWVQILALVAVGVALTQGRDVAVRAVASGGALLIGALVLLGPWVVSLVRAHGAGWSFAGSDRARTVPLRIDQLLRLQTSPNAAIGTAALAGAFVVAAAFPLFVADGSRLALSIRCWVLVVGSVLLAWGMGRGWLPSVVSGPSLIMVPAAYGLARAAGEGLGALVGEVRFRGFGWRQGLAALSLASVALSAVPITAAAADGRWGRPVRAPIDKLGWMRGLTNGGFRVAFIGDPLVLPATAVRLGPSLGVAITRDGVPTVADQWVVNETGRTKAFADSLTLARLGATTRLGAELAPLGVRYLVLVERDRAGGPRNRVPADVRQSLVEQLDLRAVDSGVDLTVYENDAWVPAVWSPLASSGLEVNGSVNTAGASNALAPAALVGSVGSVDANGDARMLEGQRLRPPSSAFEGVLEADADIVASVPPSRYWRLRVGGRSVGPVPLAGIIDAGGTTRVSAPLAGYTSPESGTARLEPRRPFPVTTALLAAMVLWAGALVLVAVDRHRRRSLHLASALASSGAADEDPSEPSEELDVFADDEFASPFVAAATNAVRRTSETPPDETPTDGSVADELWTAFTKRRLGDAERREDDGRSDT